MTTKTLNSDALQTLHLLRCGPHVLEVLADANARADALKSIGDAHNAQLHRAMNAETREFALGVQCDALKGRLKLAGACIKAADFVINDSRVKVDGVNAYLATRAAFDAVPGDVGANMSGAGLSAIMEQGDVRPVTVPANGNSVRAVGVWRPSTQGLMSRRWVPGLQDSPRVAGTIGGVPVVGDASLPDGFVRDGGPPAVDPILLAQAEHIDRLTIQRDAAEALAREYQQHFGSVAILRDLVASWDGPDDFDCGPIVDRARKLVGP